MSRLVLHIGLPKTGTTTLQKSVFPALPGVAYLGKKIPGYGFVTAELREAVAAVLGTDSILADPADRLRAAIDASRSRFDADTFVLSTESIAHPSACDLGVVAERLARAVPDAHVLVTLRSQQALALSWYRSHGRFAQYLFLHKSERDRIPAHLSQRQWWDLVSREPRAGLLAMLDFDAIVSCYADRFGGRLTLLPLELLTADPAAYAIRLASSLAVDPDACAMLRDPPHENRGLSAREVRVSRGLSMLGLATDFLEHRGTNAWRRWLARGPLADATLDASIAATIRERFAEGNSKLASRTGLDLDALGYFTSPSVAGGSPTGASPAAATASLHHDRGPGVL